MTKDKKLQLKTFSSIQIVMLILILAIFIYFVFSQFYSFWQHTESIKDRNQNKKVITTEPSCFIPKISENFNTTNSFKIKYYYFISNGDAVAFRSEEGNILYMELEEGITQSKLDSLTFTTNPTEPIEVKLEKPNLITIKFTGELKPGYDVNYLNVNDGSVEVFKVSFLNYSKEMLPKGKDYSPIYESGDF